MDPNDLPDAFLHELRVLESSYLAESGPIRQSGFGGDPARWRREREPILDAIERGGDLLGIGCANGYLLECLMAWGNERGLDITPHGFDIGAGLISLARRRLPAFAGNFSVGNAWTWRPDRPLSHVYMLLDQVPQPFLTDHLRRVMEHVVAPGGRLIAGSYGSLSRGLLAADVGGVLRSAGFSVVGTAVGGNETGARFAWADRSA